MRSEQEFTGIVRQYLNMVYRIALNWFGSVQDAEDAAQEVMLRVWKAEAVPSDKDHLRHWLVRVTVNVCKDLSQSISSGDTVDIDMEEGRGSIEGREGSFECEKISGQALMILRAGGVKKLMRQRFCKEE